MKILVKARKQFKVTNRFRPAKIETSSKIIDGQWAYMKTVEVDEDNWGSLFD
jgi:hypothetical protein